jgi:hypothetical protein
MLCNVFNCSSSVFFFFFFKKKNFLLVTAGKVGEIKLVLLVALISITK